MTAPAGHGLEGQPRGCGWPLDGECKLNDRSHLPPAGTRRAWTNHDQRCPKPNPRPSTKRRDGYPSCSLIADHDGDCDYDREAMPGPDQDRAA